MKNVLVQVVPGVKLPFLKFSEKPLLNNTQMKKSYKAITKQCPWVGAPHEISHHALRPSLRRVRIRRVRETPAVTRNELQDELKSAGTTVTQTTISNNGTTIICYTSN